MRLNIEEQKREFIRQVHRVLSGFYDPTVLRQSPLVTWFGLENRHNMISVLRQTLVDAIEALSPQSQTPRDTRLWRSYYILRKRYVEQISQREVALNLNLSVRQLQRDEAIAREALADYLWDKFAVEGKIQSVDDIDDSQEIPILEEELEYFQKSASQQVTDFDELLRDTLQTLQPLLDSTGVLLLYNGLQSTVQVYAQPQLLRLALIELLSMGLRTDHPARLQIQLSVKSDRLLLSIEAHLDAPSQLADSPTATNLEMAERLVQLCNGSINVAYHPTPELSFSALVSLSVLAQAGILIIDDNADTRQLFQRYLEGTRYYFLGATGGQQGFAQALQKRPALIVLDVMIPDQDGWELLGKLREHPDTRSIPVLICTILAQEELALALGAAGFIRKPVSRDGFLQALDHQLDQPE
ncbi:MAG: response regulator [Anaerolineae bacterium]|nr:response regulator [Anaerolineae bacterium]